MRTHRIPCIIGLIFCSLWFLSAGISTAGQRVARQGPSALQYQKSIDCSLPMDQTQEYVPGELIIKWRSSANGELIKAARKQTPHKVLRRFPLTGAQHWRLGSGMTVEQALNLLRLPPFASEIEYAQPNYIYTVDAIPDDPLRGEQWAFHNVGQTNGNPDADVDALEAWQVERGSESVVVAVIDSGIDYTHEDLAANIWTNPGEIPDNGVDDDGNGYVDDIHGWDFVNNDNDPMDDYDHGTPVAGIIGAVGNNGEGVAGVCWKVSLMPLKAINDRGSGSDATYIAAIVYAAQKGVIITNSSWGRESRYSKALEQAIASSGGLFVTSAGNSSTSQKHYPAAYSLSNIISVAATCICDNLACFSNWSPTWVDLAAPGVDVLTTQIQGGYRLFSGTSASAPFVSGTAALLLAQNPGQSVAQLKSRIMATVDILPSLAGTSVAGGRLNIRQAVGAGELPQDSIPPAVVPDLSVEPSSTTPESFVVKWTASGNDDNVGKAYVYDLRYSTVGPVSGENWATASLVQGEPIPREAGIEETLLFDNLQSETTYYLALKVLDEAGNGSIVSNCIVETTTDLGPWDIQIVDSSPSMGTYVGMDLDLAGVPAVAYDDSDQGIIKYARWASDYWNIETVALGGPGISLCHHPFTGAPTISHGWDRLLFVGKAAFTWQQEIVDRRCNKSEVTSLAYSPTSQPCISYRYIPAVNSYDKKGMLKLARREGQQWIVEIVDPDAGARYSSLAFAPNGYPFIAYSDDLDGDNTLDALKLAHWSGTAWVIETIESGGVGYGVFASLAFDPTTGFPSVVHRGGNPSVVHFLRWDGATWIREIFDEATQYTFGCDLVYSIDGTAYVAYGADGNMTIAKRNPAMGVWSIESVDTAESYPFLITILLDKDGIPMIAYGGAESTLRVAKRDSAWE